MMWDIRMWCRRHNLFGPNHWTGGAKLADVCERHPDTLWRRIVGGRTWALIVVRTEPKP